jgi:hypothetical protein
MDEQSIRLFFLAAFFAAYAVLFGVTLYYELWTSRSP